MPRTAECCFSFISCSPQAYPVFLLYSFLQTTHLKAVQWGLNSLQQSHSLNVKQCTLQSDFARHSACCLPGVLCISSQIAQADFSHLQLGSFGNLDRNKEIKPERLSLLSNHISVSILRFSLLLANSNILEV